MNNDSALDVAPDVAPPAPRSVSIRYRALTWLLGILIRVIPTRPTKPILGYVWTDGQTWRATNLETSIEIRLESGFDVASFATWPAPVLLEARSLLAMLRALKPRRGEDPWIHIEMSADPQGRPMISVAGARMIAGNPEEFPIPPSLDAAEHVATIEGLTEHLESVLHATARVKTRYAFNAVCLHPEGEGAEHTAIVATDGKRMAIRRTRASWASSCADAHLLVPSSTCKQVRGLPLHGVYLPRSDGISRSILFVGRQDADNRRGIPQAELVVASRLIEGTYPQWRSVAKSDALLGAIVDAAEFVRSLKIAASQTTEEVRAVRLTAPEGFPGPVEISWRAMDREGTIRPAGASVHGGWHQLGTDPCDRCDRCDDTVECEYCDGSAVMSPSDCRIAFDPGFLADAILHAAPTGGNVAFYVSGADVPVLIVPADNHMPYYAASIVARGKRLSIVMPMTLRSG